jgi:hypothetical protein
MNQTLKEATVKRYHYGSHDELWHHLRLFLGAHDHARHLKTLRGRTTYEVIGKAWPGQPSIFTSNPSWIHLRIKIYDSIVPVFPIRSPLRTKAFVR